MAPPKAMRIGLMDREALPSAASWKLLASALFLLALTSSGWAQGAPDFALKDVTSGQEYTLSQFKGKVILLNFFTFLCGPCRDEMPDLNEINKEFGSRGFQTLGIGLASSPAELRSLAKNLKLDYPVLAGTEEVSQAYGEVKYMPTTFIIDRQGNIVRKISQAWPKSDLVRVIKPLL